MRFIKHDLGKAVIHGAGLAGDAGIGNLHTVNHLEAQVVGQPSGVLSNFGGIGCADAQTFNLQALEAGVIDIDGNVIALIPAN